MNAYLVGLLTAYMNAYMNTWPIGCCRAHNKCLLSIVIVIGDQSDEYFIGNKKEKKRRITDNTI